MGKPQEQSKGFFRTRIDRWSVRQAETLYRQVSGSSAGRPGWGLARFLSYALALCIHLFCVALLGTGIWLLVAMPNVISIVLAIFALLLAFELRPRLGSLRKVKNLRRREDAPVLFGILDQVASEVGAKQVHAVVTDMRWNASYAAVGWRRRRIVTIGLPLWETLAADQKVAVLGHEFAHGVNGDARHGTIVGTSLATLMRLHSVLRPGPRLRRRRQITDDLARMVQAMLRSLVAGAYTAQQLISLRAGQRAEYLADAIAARVASPGSMADALDTILTGQDTYTFVLERRRFRDPGAGFWDQLRSAQSAIPESEKERRRRLNARSRPQVTNTHPPSHLRIRMLKDLPASEAAVALSAVQEEKIRAELAENYSQVGQRIDNLMRFTP